VALHELVGEDERWFFTMECIDGVDFLSGVREPAAGCPAAAVPPVTQTLNGSGDDTVTSPARGSPAPRASEPRLRAALRGLATGVAALHDAGYLHRDIKPQRDGDPGGRVVLTDGLRASPSGVAAAERRRRGYAGLHGS
jgi:hypothetical protein